MCRNFGRERLKGPTDILMVADQGRPIGETEIRPTARFGGAVSLFINNSLSIDRGQSQESRLPMLYAPVGWASKNPMGRTITHGHLAFLTFL